MRARERLCPASQSLRQEVLCLDTKSSSALKPCFFHLNRVAGLIVTISNGAASLRGRLAPENEGSRPPARLIVHLVPVETASADDILRYAEAVAGKEGAFEFKNIAPGKYRLIARAAQDDAPIDRPATPIAWDVNERARPRKEAEALKVEVDLKPCQRVSDQVVKYRYIANRTRGFYVKTQFRTQHSLFAFHFA